MTVQTENPDIVLEGAFTEDEERTWRHIPFEMPSGVQQARFVVSYNDMIGSDPMLSGGNTLDIGLFDELGIESGSPGFRGWSGSNKLEITIAEDWATPPYRAGSLNAGTWHLLLGPYKVGPNNLNYQVAIFLNESTEAPGPSPIPDISSVGIAADLPPVHPNWYRGDLHAHTIYSDGSATPIELAIAARRTGLDFFGITDHNRAQSPVGLVPQGEGWPVLVPGVEVTTYAGHFNVWGTDHWYDFRNPTAEGIQAAVDAARADGGLISINHPKPFGPPWEFPEVTGFDCIEPWNGWWGTLNTDSLAEWDRRLKEGECLVGVCGSDVHHPSMSGDGSFPLAPARMGWPTLWINTNEPLSVASILDAVKVGRSFISESPSGPQVYVDLEEDELRVEVAGAAGTAMVLVGPEGVIAAIGIRSDSVTCTWPVWELPTVPFIRVEIHSAGGGIRALSQPVFLND